MVAMPNVNVPEESVEAVGAFGTPLQSCALEHAISHGRLADGKCPTSNDCDNIVETYRRNGGEKPSQEKAQWCGGAGQHERSILTDRRRRQSGTGRERRRDRCDGGNSN